MLFYNHLFVKLPQIIHPFTTVNKIQKNKCIYNYIPFITNTTMLPIALGSTKPHAENTNNNFWFVSQMYGLVYDGIGILGQTLLCADRGVRDI